MKVIITGATKGIGKAIAEVFLQQGADVAICARNEQDLQQLQQQWKATFPKAKILTQVVDVSKLQEVENFAQAIKNQWKTVDVLINNAGLFLQGSMLSEPSEQLSKMLQVNVLGVHYLVRAVVPFLKKPYGQIINICSVASRKPFLNSGSYSVSKYALLGYTNNLREELRTEQIKVTAVLPGATWSDSWKGVDLPTQRIMAATEVAKTVWNICQLDASAVIEEVVLRPPLGDL